MPILRKRFAARLILAFLALVIMVPGAMARPDTLNRDEIPDKYKWDLNEIYPDWETWENDLGRIEEMMDQYTKLQGSLAGGPQQILKANQMGDDLGKVAAKLFRYASLHNVTSMADNEIAGRLQQVRIIFARFGTAMAWYNPEMLLIPWETMEKWLDETPELAPYRFGITDLYRQQEHVLSEDKEQLLSYFNQALGSPAQIYNELATADISYPEVTLSDGETVTMTPGKYYSILSTNRNQEDRRKAFEAFYGIFHEKANTYASIYNGILQGQWASTQARNYDTSLQATLDGNDIPVEVYENLVQMVREGSGPVHRYIALRKKVLGLEEYHGYDGSIPLVDFDKSYPWESIREDIVKSVEPLGSAYQDKMKDAFSGGWVDVYENEGKRSGAFSAGVYGVHPYMLLNYNETLNSFFTAAHEMGHTLHTMLSHENQPYSTSNYTIFVAEVASTLNERLLLDHMLDKSDDPLEMAALLTHTIDDIIGTFYSQVMFADYELQANRLVQDGVPITADVLTDIYTKLWQGQNGEAATFDEFYGSTWARISHFYTVPYYVYQYATCYASSAQIYSEIKSDDADVRESAVYKYLELLKSGGNDHPMEQLKKAGVDLAKPEAFQAVIDNLDGLVTRLEEVLGELEKQEK
ncbi:MAG: oligoendopeptidase F [Gemmatimonadales bacterium]|nr:oligoendopeptidase F [Gemmatimonadales bacterium]